ncbi:hypothetical protein ACOBQX_05890 [Actinokineospora sp. G85]|uniref:hypothetical protein n=1 Tax=Actinokineospora sp. G85 TaxID=3406626 RepID=UPI003C780431
MRGGRPPSPFAIAEPRGPIGTARGCALAGECFERAGDPVLAEDRYVQALRVDPYAISAARGRQRVRADRGMGELADGYAKTLLRWGRERQTRSS